MNVDVALILIIIAVMFMSLLFELARPVIIVAFSLAAIIFLGILTPAEAVQGFSNIGMLTIALLFIIGGTVQKSELFSTFVHRLLGNNLNISVVLFRLMIPVTSLSAFINNTPIVTMLLGEIRNWCSKHGIKPSKLLIPLSYAAIFGGMITLIGTSTNLIIHGLMIDAGYEGYSLFQLAVVGLPAGIIGITYMATIGQRLLPNKDTPESSVDSKEYLVEMVVEQNSPIIGHTIKQARLRNLEGLYLFEIIREGQIIAPVTSNEKLKANDRLIFTGQASSVLDLYQIPGLKHTVGKTLKLEDLLNDNAKIVEIIIPSHSNLINKTIKQSQFRGRFDAVVIAVHRKNERIKGKIGDIVIKPGDSLLLIAGHDFHDRCAYSRDLYLVDSNKVLSPSKLTSFRSLFAIFIMIAMILSAAFNLLSIFEAAILAVIALFISRCVTFEEAGRFIHLDILILIACSLGIGYAVEKTGAASWIAESIIQAIGDHRIILLLAAIYLITNIITELITNSAAAVIMFPIAMETALKSGVDPFAFFVVITIAASAAFSSPIGYQTHLLVYGPGGYSFKDFLKVGIPLNLIYMLVTVALVSIIFL